MQQAVQDFVNYIGNLPGVPPEGIGAAMDTIQGFYREAIATGNINFALYKMVEHVMRSKAVPEHTQHLYQLCINNVIDHVIDGEFRYGTETLRFIFDTSMEYYKHHSLDSSLRNPLGLNRKLNYYQPEVGEDVDVVKPYITSTSYCVWTRGTLLTREGKKYTVRYENTEMPSTVTSQPWFDLLGSRTPDYQWRNNLGFGSLVDALSKFWYPATVVQVGVENGSRRVRVSFRRFSENGKRVDSDGNRYDGLGPNEDDWIDIYSCRIQKPGKMAHEFCEYSHTCEEIVVDDTYDLLFEKEYDNEPFAGVMRCSLTRSLSFLHFYEHFWKRHGNELFLQALKKRDLPIDNYVNILIALGNTSSLVPRMGLQRHLPAILSETIAFMKEQYKQFNLFRLDALSYFIDIVGKRLFSLSRKHIILNDLRRFLSLEYLKLNLEKQMIAMKYIFELIRPYRPYQNEAERQELHSFLTDNQILYRIVQPNAHQQILGRSSEIIKYMLEQGLAGWPEIQHIWGIVPHSDLRGRTTVERLIAEISKDFPFEFTAKILDKLLSVKQTELTADKLHLLRVLKDRALNTEYKVKILNYLWECLTVKATSIKQQVEEEVESVFRGFISTIKEGALKLEVLRAILRRLREITTVRTEMYLFKEFILTYPLKQEPIQDEQGEIDNSPKMQAEVVDFLKREQIYDVLLRLLGCVKAKEKVESILEFLHFLFQRDRDDISQTVKAIYELLGPSDTFLLWARSLTSRATAFFVEMYQNPTSMQKFKNLSSQALEAIKSILLDVNVAVGNIRVLRKRKVVPVVQGPLLPNQTTIGTSTSQQQPESNLLDANVAEANIRAHHRKRNVVQLAQGPTLPNQTSIDTSISQQDYSLKPDNKGKEEVVTFVYVLKSPFECIGVSFLLELCQHMTAGSLVYTQVVRLIVQFIVNLDDSIVEHTTAFRQQFLSTMFGHIAQLATSTDIAAAKPPLDLYFNLVQELLAETQRQGLGDIRPHMSTIEGQVMRLKIENCISGNELFRKEHLVVQVNENITFWELKLRLSTIYGEPPSKIDIIKYVNPIGDINNGKLITDLHFFNDEGIKVSRRDPKDIPRYELLSQDKGSLAPQFELIVQEWFSAYSHEGLMRAEDLLRLSSEKWKGSILKDEKKLQEVISEYDKQGRGGISLSDFKDFFWLKATENNALVWRILNLAGYRNNLRHRDTPDPPLPASPRKILSSRPIYDTIYQLLANQALQTVHLSYYKLLGMLESDLQLCTQVKGNIRDFLEKEKCIYRLSYGLESLINQLQNSLPLYAEFYQHGGHIEIANKLQGFFTDPEKSIYSFDTSLKTIVIPNLLKILNCYIYPITSQNRMVRFLKKVRINHLDLPEIVKRLQAEQSYADPQEQKRRLLEGAQLDLSALYDLGLRILQNLTKNFNTEFLVKATHECFRLYAYLSFAHSGFLPEHAMGCSNSGSLNIRRSAQALLYLYMLERPGESFILLEKLVRSIPAAGQVKYSSNTYFELIRHVLEKALEGAAEGESTTNFLTNLALQLLQQFFKAPIEHRQSYISSRTLQGILQVLSVIIQKRPAVAHLLRHFREKLIEQGLFFYNVREKLDKVEITPEMLQNQTQSEHFPNYVKCKTEGVRKLLMEVVAALYKESEPQQDFFQRYLLPVLIELPDTARRTSAKSLHVGLNNLGSTCYLNSMLQVLNSIEPFRNLLMRGPPKAALVKQLQALFSYLFFSQRLDYVPRELLGAFVPQIVPSIQQDTTEFLNFLFDQLEPQLKDSPYRLLLEELFKGSQVAQMICHACGAKRERQQTFFSYSVEIEGKYDLQSALDGMHAGQLISDCLCESCGARSDTTKRNVLKEVPNIFFVHLKRIVFDYNMFVNTKIHTRLYFPEELDYEPFTKEGLELREAKGVEYMKGLKDNQEQAKKFAEQTLHGRSKQFYKLKLKAVIVHSGTPDVGHYYAIIKKGANWVKFDDSQVSCFPLSFFQEECYGGSWVADEWGGVSSSKNAYVLIYQKDHKREIVVEQRQDDGAVVRRQLSEKELGTYNTPEWYKQVWLDNHSLMLEQHLTGEHYTKDFLNFLCTMLELTPSTATLQIISEVFSKICALSGEVGRLPEIFLKHLDQIDGYILDRYVLADPKRTFSLLFHQQAKVREFASTYLDRVLMLCYQKGDAALKEKVVRFIQQYLQALHGQVAKNWLRIDGYFKLIQRLVQSSLAFPDLYVMFVSSDMIAYLIDFIMEKQSPLNVYQKKYSLGTKSNPVSFGSGLNTVLFLLKRSYGFVGNNFEQPAMPINEMFHLSDNAVACLSCMAFYEKMIKENQNPFAIAAIIQRLCILNLSFSQAIARVLLKIFNENTDTAEECDTVLLCISRVLNIKDDFWKERAEMILGYVSAYIFQKNAMSYLQEEKYVYPTTLENAFPLESLLSYIHINRARVPLTVLNMIKCLLQSTSCSEQAMDYLLSQPAPAYTHLRYIDWLRPYVNEVLNGLTISDKKKEECQGKVSLCNLYLDDLQKRIQAKQIPMFVQVLGQVGQRTLVYSKTDLFKILQLNIYQVKTFGVESLPNGKGNGSFDRMLTNGRLETLATDESTILRFFKQSSKPLAIKAKNVDQTEDKQLISLFDQDPYPKKDPPPAQASKAPEQMIAEQPENPKQSPPQASKQSPSPLQPIEEIVPVQLNVQGARELEDYLHLIEITNNTDTNRLAVLYIEAENANLPRCLRVMAGKSKEEYYFHKTNPYAPIGKLDIQMTVCDYIENTKQFFRLYGSPIAQPQPIPPPSEPQEQQPPQPHPKEQMEVEGDNHNPNNADFDYSDQINCPICTYLNPLTNTECDVCGSALHQA